MPDRIMRDAVAERIPGGNLLVLDESDHQIIALLRQDGRMAFKAIAEATSLAESNVRTRIRRLEDSDVLRVVAVTDFVAAGYNLMLAVGVQVEGRPADQVARDLAAIPQVFSVCQVVGTHDIECLMVAEDQAAVSELVTTRLASVAGVRRLLPAMAIDVRKNQPNWVLFDNGVSKWPRGKGKLDELDTRIVDVLALDARTSNRKIATELGVTEGTVRQRIKRMEEEGQIRITAVTNIDHLRNPTLAYIWIEVDSAAEVKAVATQLADVQQIGFVAVTLGRFDILAITLVQNNGQLAEFLNTRVSVIPGVRRTECSLGVTFVKHDYRMTRILPGRWR